MENATVLVVDDHTMVREMWTFLLDEAPGFTVIGEAGNGSEAIELAKRLRPDIIIMDINMPGLSGIEATQLIHSYCPESRILGVSLHAEPAYVRQMVKKGAMGYLTKNSTRHEFLKAMAALRNNQKYICEEIRIKIANELLEQFDEPKPGNTLTKREIQIVVLIKNSLTSAEIGTQLGISLRTVEAHRYNVLKKLKLKNYVELINYVNTMHLEQDPNE